MRSIGYSNCSGSSYTNSLTVVNEMQVSFSGLFSIMKELSLLKVLTVTPFSNQG